MNKSGYGIALSRLSCFAMAEGEGKVWFVRTQANGLYEFDQKENRTKLLMHFPGVLISKEHLYFAIEKVNNILVIAPASASKIVFYDLAIDKAEYLELAIVEDKRKVKYEGSCKFLKSYRHGNSVYLFGFEYPAVLKVNVRTKEVIYFTDWVKEVERRIKKLSVTMGYVSDYVVLGDYVWALCECADAVLRLDLQTDEIRIIDINSDLDVRCGMCYDGNFWVAGYNENANKLLKYDIQLALEDEIEICSSQSSGGEYSLSLQNNLWEIYPVIDLGERLLLFSVYPRHVYEFDKSLHEVRINSVFEELLEIRDEQLHDMGILVPRKKGNLICFITGNDFLWNEYDFVNDTIKRYEVKEEFDDELLRIKLKFMNGRIFMENEMIGNLRYQWTLSRFLEHIVYVPRAEMDNMEKDNSVGTKIYEKNSKEVSLI